MNRTLSVSVFCKDCEHKLKPAGAMYENDPNSLCRTSHKLNYVTGNKDMQLCKDINKTGKCNMFIFETNVFYPKESGD